MRASAGQLLLADAPGALAGAAREETFRGWRRVLAATGVSAFLSVLFVVVYGGCNRLTTMRSDVGVFAFGWERWIPFVPLMIVPYMSIDLFFVAAPFLCGTRRELRVFARRIAACIVIAGVCFLLFPLRMSFTPPAVGGVLGAIFARFHTMDLPYNEFPSLHIALRTVLAATYARHSRGVLRWGLHVWFSLIGLSTLFTYQHHVIDVAGGFVLAAACCALFTELPREEKAERNLRVGGYYLLGMLLLVGAAIWSRPTGILLLFPACALGVVAAGHFGMGARVYGKKDGRLAWFGWILFWPVWAGQYASLWFYARQCRARDRLTAHVWIGRRLTQREALRAMGEGVTAVVDLTGEFSELRAFRAAAYLCVPILDLTAPSAGQLAQAVAFVEEQAARGGVVYVHCKAGYSRTAIVAGAWLLASGRARDAEEAVEQMREVRPAMVVRPEAWRALRRFETAMARGDTATAVS